jgi:hypothetical protein
VRQNRVAKENPTMQPDRPRWYDPDHPIAVIAIVAFAALLVLGVALAFSAL